MTFFTGETNTVSFTTDEFHISKRQKLYNADSEVHFENNSAEAEITHGEINEKDLPLLSNIDQVRVSHYLLKLQFDMDSKTVTGSAVLFLKWNLENRSPKNIPTEMSSKDSSEVEDSKNKNLSNNAIILDCCFLKVHKVDLLCRTTKKGIAEEINETNQPLKQFGLFTKPEIGALKFTLTTWSLSISASFGNNEELPSVIRIHYETLPNTPSLHWRPSVGFDYHEQSRNVKSVYTPASPVNNRGLFPCQEPPCAMATWECLVKLKTCENYQALLSSDSPGNLLPPSNESDIFSTYYYNCSAILPMSTFAITIGRFSTCIYDLLTAKSEMNDFRNQNAQKCKEQEELHGRIQSYENKLIPVRLCSFCDYSSFNSSWVAIEELSVYIKYVLTTAFSILGPHPFSRLDLVIMPRCFPSLGLANPNMIFLSPSVFQGSRFDSYSCFSRIAHEIAHSWFGLLIGALDWTEEWLSEGFATYMEDILYKKAASLILKNESSSSAENEKFLQEQLSLKSVLRAINLRNELNVTESENQVLSHFDPSDCKSSNGSVKNGLVPEKQFMQVHYLKGYFFLKHLCDISGGEEKFLAFLKCYIKHFHAQLVTSEMFLQYFQIFFKETHKWESKGFPTVEDLKFKWLTDTNLQEPLKSVGLFTINFPHNKNDLEIFNVFPDCKNPLLKSWRGLNMCSESENFEFVKTLTSIELVYCLENILLLVGEKFSRKLCIKLMSNLGLIPTEESTLNNFVPDVLHCFCEIIVQIRSRKSLNVVEKFLLEHPAMGVYLYGELMISEKKVFQNSAIHIYNEQKCVLDPSVVKVLKEMLF